jgi:hypothetical protein
LDTWLQRTLPSVFSYREGSWLNRVRSRRAELIRPLLESLPNGNRPARILDIGGTHHYWSAVGPLDPSRYAIPLLNRTAEPLPDTIRGFRSLTGDALDLPFESGEFDAVFSNSVIEHVGSHDNQRRMADEIRRVAPRYIVQTPSLWFPIEPHCHLPGFQFLPHPVRAVMIRHLDINYFPSRPTYRECLEVSRSTLMLGRRRFQSVFPEARILRERFGGLTKSYLAVHGFETA